MPPAVGDKWSAAWPPTPAPGLVVTAAQAVATLVPGCSGKVVPGAPASANAGLAPIVMKAPVTKIGTMRRCIAPPLTSQTRRGQAECNPRLADRQPTPGRVRARILPAPPPHSSFLL